MKLKKIDPNLQKALAEAGLTEANSLQEETFSLIKSGADAVIQAPAGSGKTATIVIACLQVIGKMSGESTRAVIFVETKEKVLEMVDMFNTFGNYKDVRVFGVHEKGDTDFDKNHISLGLDILIGTPTKLNNLFSSAGFNMNTVKMFIVDDADVLFKSRMDSIVQRLSGSTEKTQRLFFCSHITERVETLAETIMIEPAYIEFD